MNRFLQGVTAGILFSTLVSATVAYRHTRAIHRSIASMIDTDDVIRQRVSELGTLMRSYEESIDSLVQELDSCKAARP